MSTVPDCAETFADSVNSVFFDGQTMRIEFGITRMDEMKKDQPLTGRRYPACRLVLAPAAAIDLINKMQQTAAGLAAGRPRQTGRKSRAAAGQKRLISSRSKHIKKPLYRPCRRRPGPAIGSPQGGRSCAAYLQFQEPT